MTSDVHPFAQIGYEAAANTYVAGRPDYPDAIVTWLREDLGLDAAQLAVDLAAGTGKFVPMLQRAHARVIAIEPVAAMRAALASKFPNVKVLDGTATAIPLDDASIDAVICAQSFHWFATRAALKEIHRVLRPGGTLALVWNVRDESVPWVRSLSALIAPYEGDTPRYHAMAWRSLFPADDFSALEERSVPHAHRGPASQVIVERTLSVSFIAALPAMERTRVETRVRQWLEEEMRMNRASIVEFPYLTSMFWCRKLA